eukprot:TRINITY_DN40365_c0_g1_i1.p1 TRINITY_DN40365_c0_g1~~TRINITY_DN40365_c0_g1_i1.p1  ORF type:complete len:217 (+),score=23.38 TRINITY_DN40365_c0_g1_i1:81-653(+)
MVAGSGFLAVRVARTERWKRESAVKVNNFVSVGIDVPSLEAMCVDQDDGLDHSDRDMGSGSFESLVQHKTNVVELDKRTRYDPCPRMDTCSESHDCELLDASDRRKGSTKAAVGIADFHATPGHEDVRVAASSAFSQEWSFTFQSDPESDDEVQTSRLASSVPKFAGALSVSRARSLRRALEAKASNSLG